LRLLLNILWFVFGGWISGTLWVLAAGILALTVVGLPWTPAALRIAGFSYAPFGKHVVPRDTGSVSFLFNVIWFVFAGWWLALHHIVIACVQAVTIIGIPFAVQHVKLALLSLTPVGADVVESY
jgi:uncharacterized membrane protein YccF (DUF307 family)